MKFNLFYWEIYFKRQKNYTMTRPATRFHAKNAIKNAISIVLLINKE